MHSFGMFRFILEQLQKESIQNRSSPSQRPDIDQLQQSAIIDLLFGSTCLLYSKCMSCKLEKTRDTRSFQYDMMMISSGSNEGSQTTTTTTPVHTGGQPTTSGTDIRFCSILKTSLKRENHTKAWQVSFWREHAFTHFIHWMDRSTFDGYWLQFVLGSGVKSVNAINLLCNGVPWLAYLMFSVSTQRRVKR